MAHDIAVNSKCSNPAVCNAAETLLVSRAIARDFLPMAKKRLDTKHVELRGCPETCAILGDAVVPAARDDYGHEFGDYILAVKAVAGLDETILDEVDAAAVYVNASTRFTDGGEFGLGAEIGISTQKMHARGPMGVAELTSSKYIIYGQGQIR